jgi:hypothetical protein
MRTILSLLFLFAAIAAQAQERNIRLNIHATSVAGDDLTGQEVVLKHTDYDMTYETLRLDAAGDCSVLIYAGPHLVTIQRDGFERAEESFSVAEGTSEYSVSLNLTEKTRAPFALTATCDHNAYTGTDDVLLAWNTEAPAFFDDFESYPGWAVSFGEWTGIDGDGEAALNGLNDAINDALTAAQQEVPDLLRWWDELRSRAAFSYFLLTSFFYYDIIQSKRIFPV